MAARKPKCKTKCCAETPLKLGGVSDGELLARLAKVLGHPARVTILRMLIDRDSCVCGEIVGELLKTQGTDCLPLVVVDGQVASRGQYPLRELLSQWAGVVPQSDELPVISSKQSCCGGTSCC